MSGFARSWFLFLILAFVCESGVAAQRGASFRSNVDLISLMVSVTNPGGRYMSGLEAEDFEVFEDGRLQELAFFSPANTALSVSLLLDSSSSMEDSMSLAQKAAVEFVARLKPDDLVEIVSFDSRVEVMQPFTNDRTLLEGAIHRVRAGGSTSLYNAVYITLRQFEKLRAQNASDSRREVIVVLSDGEDTSSLMTSDEILDLAKRSQTVIFAIGLGFETPALPVARSGEFDLRRLAQETGGRLFTPKRPEDLSNVYTEITRELTTQYVLGYLSRNDRRDGRWRSISVRLRRPQLQARTRAGYYAAKQ